MMLPVSAHRRWVRPVLFIGLFALLFLGTAVSAGYYFYRQQLKPVSSSQTVKLIKIASGSTLDQIAQQLKAAGLIRNVWVFKYYITSHSLQNDLQAGEYELQPRMAVSEIMAVLTHGKVVTNLLTITPGKRIDQIQERFKEDGYARLDIEAALNPATYAGNPALVDLPAGTQTLEGYLYPESYQRTSATTPQDIVTAALLQMQQRFTPQIKDAFVRQGLTPYQGLVLASIVEREVHSDADRAQAAQVFLKRLRVGMRLESDATKFYYNTYSQDGLPPHPISNVSESSLKAVANPANTDWLYFVAGNDGVTRFSKTFAEHEENIRRTCTAGYCGQ
jgi:UPF0755 protein